MTAGSDVQILGQLLAGGGRAGVLNQGSTVNGINAGGGGQTDPLQKLLQLTLLRSVLANQQEVGGQGSILDPAAIAKGQSPGIKVAGGGNIPILIRGAKPNKLTQAAAIFNNVLTGLSQGKANKRKREQDKQLQSVFDLILSQTRAGLNG